MKKLNNFTEVTHEYNFDNDFTYEELMEIKKKDSWLLKQLALNYFWIFCMLIFPEIYNDKHKYLKIICDFIQGTWEDPNAKYVSLSIPPQHGKSLSMNLFALWTIIKDIKIRIFNISYNDDAATEASVALLDRIKQTKDNNDEIIANDFRKLELKRGQTVKNKWTVMGGRLTWFSSSPNSGTVTGKSAQLVILDDLIKDYKTSISKAEKKKITTFISATLMSRQSGGVKFYIPQTRWCKDDPIGFLVRIYGDKVRQLKMKAYDPIEDKMLCESFLKKSDYEDIIRANKINDTLDVVEANYNQEPIDVKGCLISHYNKWDNDTFPKEIDIKKSFSVTDTSDTGSDNWATLFGVITRDNKIFITDLLYTSDSVEHTIPEVSKKIIENKTKFNIFESNNGGRVIALDVKKEINKNGWYGNVKWFHQKNNKETRIGDNAGKVMNQIWWPPEFDQFGKWERFFEDFTNYQREFTNNEHDDCLDVSTMCIEYLENRLLTD